MKRLVKKATPLGDLKSAKLIILKGFLFLLIGVMAVAGILVEHPEPRLALLLALAIWAFARFYYFAFYVIEKYVDPGYKFAGLWSFAAYMAGRWRGAKRDAGRDDERGI